MKSMRFWLFLLLIVLFAVPVNAIQVVASNTVQYSNTSVTASSASAQWFNTTYDNASGTINLSVQLKAINPYTDVCSGPITAYYQFYADDVALGTEQSTTSLTFIWLNQTDVAITNLVNLSLKVWPTGTGSDDDFCISPPPAATNADAENLYVMYDYGYEFTNGTLEDQFGYSLEYPLDTNIINTENITHNMDIQVDSNPSNYNERFGLDEGSGSYAYGVNSTSKHIGTLFNTSFVPWGASFNHATPSYINVSNYSDLVGFSTFDVRFKAQYTGGQLTAGHRAALLSSWGSDANQNNYLFRWNTDSSPHEFQIYLRNASGEGNVGNSFVAPVNLTDGAVHTIQIDYNGSAVILEIDGLKSSTVSPFSGTLNPNSSAQLYIGDSPHAPAAQGWTGLINDVIFYNRNLSDSERRLSQNFTLYNNGIADTNNMDLGIGKTLNGVCYNASNTNDVQIFVNTSSNNETWSGYNEITPDGNLSCYGVPDSNNEQYYNIRLNLSNGAIITNFSIYSQPSPLYFISPTRINQSETWNINNTEIRIYSTSVLNNSTLYWGNHDEGVLTWTQYSMNEINSTTWNYSFSNLLEDYYYYYVVGNVNGTNYTTSTYWVKIDQSLGMRDLILLYKNNTDPDSYMSALNTETFTNWTRVEPEYYHFTSWNADAPMVLIKRCYNSTVWYYDAQTSCAGGDSSTTLGYLYGASNIHTVPVKRYYNSGTNRYVTLADRTNIPSGYVFDMIIGYSPVAMPHEEDIIYINNSKRKVGIDTKFGGTIVWLSELNSSKNFINNWDAGRQIQNSYWDGKYVTNPVTFPDGNKYMWNPIQSGSAYNEPSYVISYSNTSNSATFTVNESYFFRSAAAFGWIGWGTERYSDLQMISTYSFDGEEPVLITNYTYIHLGDVNHSRAYQEAPAIWTTAELSKFYYNNGTGITQTNITYAGNFWCYGSCSYTAAVNSTNYGIGSWNWGHPYGTLQNFSINTSNIDPYAEDSNYVSPHPYFGINATGHDGDRGTNIGKTYLGNLTDMNTYFLSLDFGGEFDPITPINQTITEHNITFRVNTTADPILDATLFLTNGTGTYEYSLTVDTYKEFASVTLNNLPKYNYSYYIDLNSTTGANAVTPTVWTNIFYYPASVTSINMETGNFFINNTWINPVDADFNHTMFKYVNGTILQNVSTTFLNLTYSPHYVQNISAQTVDTSENINETKVWFNVTIPDNPIIISGITEGQSFSLNEGETFYVDVNYSDSDNDNGTFYDNSSEWNIDTSTGIISWVTVDGDQGIYSYSVNVTNATYNSISIVNFTVTVGDSTPGIPTITGNTTGNFYVNYTFIAGANTDYLNISQNGSWVNGTLPTFNNVSVGAHGYSNLTVCGYNSTLDLLSSCASDSVQIANNQPVLSSIGNKNVVLGQYLNFTVSATDADSDTLTYGTNASNGTLNTTSGEYSWLTNNTGTFIWYFNATESYGGLYSETIIVTVSEGEFMPPTPINCISTNTTSSINVSCEKGVGNVTDEFRFYNQSVWYNTSALFWNNTGLPEGQEETIWIYAFNSSGNGTLNNTYAIEINTTATTPEAPDTNTTPALTSVTNSTCLAHSCVVSFDVNQSNALTMVKYGLNESLLQNTVNQSSDISRTDNLTGLTNNTKYYYSVFAWNSSNASYNTNSTIQNFTTDEDYIPPEPTYAPAITSYAPETPNSTQVSISATFNVTVNQTVNVTWYINGSLIETDSSTTDAAYTNSSSVVGSWNVTAIASNVNGSDSQTWLWTVTAIPTYPPVISAYTPADLTPTIDVNELATFTATANQSVTWDAWSGATELSENGTYTSATQTWTTTGAKTVIIDCSNANGSCTPIQWDVTVVSDGSGGSGTNWDWLSGTISPSGATLTTNATPNTCSVVGTTYSCGYDFVDGNAYWFNFSKSGYTANNSTIVFNEDHEVFNVSLAIVPAAVTVVTNAATSIRTNGATLNGAVNFSGGGTLDMWFEYGTNGRTYPYKTTTQTTSINTTFSHGLYKSNIMANTKYYYRAVAYYNNIYYYGE